MTQKEQARLQVLNSLLAEHTALDQATTLMGVSTRHTRRILAAYREECAAADPEYRPWARSRGLLQRYARNRIRDTRHTCPRLSQEPFRLVMLPSGIYIGWRDSIIVRSVELLAVLELSRDFRTP